MKNRKWTIEKLQKEADKYYRRVDFQKNSNGAYLSACRLGVLNSVCSHMEPPATKKYTDEEIFEIAKRYTRRTDFQKNSKAYASAFSKGKDFLDLVCSHMEVIKRPKHTIETARQDALKYKTKREFCVNDAGSYLAALKNGWINDICLHMVRSKKGKASKQELVILSICQELYPSAKSKVFKNETPSKYRQKFYELDIYIPEIKKGIEFDGDYWHSIEVLQKTRKISRAEAEKYHDNKDSFFGEFGIEILHIKEINWKNDNLWLRRKIMSFIDKLPEFPASKKAEFYRRNSEEYLEELKGMENE